MFYFFWAGSIRPAVPIGVPHALSASLAILCRGAGVVFRRRSRPGYPQGTEPKIPAACVTLDARIAARHGVIAPRDERNLIRYASGNPQTVK
jgi:hypothetical protein